MTERSLSKYRGEGKEFWWKSLKKENFWRNDRNLPESFFKKVVAIFLFCMKSTKKSAAPTIPTAFDSYPALFQKKKEILHKMKRRSWIVSFYEKNKEGFSKISRNQKEKNGLIKRNFCQFTWNRQRNKKHRTACNTERRCKKRRREVIVQIAVIFLTIW